MATDDDETLVLWRLVWMGNAKRNLQAFPRGARKLIGDEPQLIQFGGMPKEPKPFKGVGSGVFEIALRYEGGAYRTVLAVAAGRTTLRAARLSEEVEEGDSNTRPDVDLIKQRYKVAKELAEHE